MTMLLCEPAAGADDGPVDEATAEVRSWLARELRFERLLDGWRAAAGDDGSR